MWGIFVFIVEFIVVIALIYGGILGLVILWGLLDSITRVDIGLWNNKKLANKIKSKFKTFKK